MIRYHHHHILRLPQSLLAWHHCFLGIRPILQKSYIFLTHKNQTGPCTDMWWWWWWFSSLHRMHCLEERYFFWINTLDTHACRVPCTERCIFAFKQFNRIHSYCMVIRSNFNIIVICLLILLVSFCVKHEEKHVYIIMFVTLQLSQASKERREFAMKMKIIWRASSLHFSV